MGGLTLARGWMRVKPTGTSVTTDCAGVAGRPCRPAVKRSTLPGAAVISCGLPVRASMPTEDRRIPCVSSGDLMRRCTIACGGMAIARRGWTEVGVRPVPA